MSEFKNIVYFYVSTFFSLLLSILIFLILIKNLNIQEFGIYSKLISLIITLTFLLDFGFSNMAWKKISENEKNFEKIFCTSLLFYSSVSLVLFSIFLIFKQDIFIFLIFIFSFLSNLFRSFLYGLGKMKELMISDIFSYLFKLLILIIFLKNITLQIAIFSVFLHFFSSFVIRLFFLFEKIKNIKPSFFNLDLYGLISSYLLSILPILYSNFSVIFFSLFSLELSALIYFSFSLTSIIFNFSSPFYLALLPYISKKQDKKTIKFSIKFSFLLNILLFTFSLLFLKEITFLINKEYLNYINEILLLFFSFTFLFLASVLNFISFSLGKFKEIITIELIANILLFSSSLFLNIFSFLLSFLIRFILYSFLLKNFLEKKIFYLLIFLSFSLLLVGNLILKILIFLIFLFSFFFFMKKIKIFTKSDIKTLKKLKFPNFFIKLFSKLF
jgi:O-antigen/teichoic acid export membrane protein